MRPVDADHLLWCCKKRMDIEGRLRRRDYAYLKGIRDCIKEVENAPTVEPERKKGEWILCENPIYFSFRTVAADPYLCTICDMKNDRQTKYCPNCGAEMEVE